MKYESLKILVPCSHITFPLGTGQSGQLGGQGRAFTLAYIYLRLFALTQSSLGTLSISFLHFLRESLLSASFSQSFRSHANHSALGSVSHVSFWESLTAAGNAWDVRKIPKETYLNWDKSGLLLLHIAFLVLFDTFPSLNASKGSYTSGQLFASPFFFLDHIHS